MIQFHLSNRTFSVLCVWGLLSLGKVAWGHGNPITVNADQGKLTVTNIDSHGIPGFDTGDLSLVNSIHRIVGDLPGIEVARPTDGIAPQATLGLDILSPLVAWDLEQVLPSTAELTVYSPSSATLFYTVTGESGIQRGLVWDTYTGAFAWHSHGLFALGATAEPGIYGLVAQLTSPSYNSSDPFLMTWIYDPNDDFAPVLSQGVQALHDYLFPTPLGPDLNGDGAVDASDAGIMFGNWEGSGAGDLNHDNVVDAADAGTMFAAWTGDSIASPARAVTAVPEPTTTAFTVGILSWFLFTFRRGRMRCIPPRFESFPVMKSLSSSYSMKDRQHVKDNLLFGRRHWVGKFGSRLGSRSPDSNHGD